MFFAARRGMVSGMGGRSPGQPHRAQRARAARVALGLVVAGLLVADGIGSAAGRAAPVRDPQAAGAAAPVDPGPTGAPSRGPAADQPATGASCLPDPHPCGAVWPAGLDGPFALREVRHVQVRSHDGTVLDGWIGFPDVPAGVRVPVVLNSTPYLSYCLIHPTSSACLRNPGSSVAIPGSGTWWDDGPLHEDQLFAGLGIAPIEWIRRGYALAAFSVRGGGTSGGCTDMGGTDEQLDQEALVDWLGAQPWSNGRVGMGGLSYPGFTTWQAAVQAPTALKAIASVAPVTDLYTLYFSPQGARSGAGVLIAPTLGQQYSSPPVFADPDRLAVRTLRNVGCGVVSDDGRDYLIGMATKERDEAYYAERDLRPRLGDVRAAVLHAQGYDDPGHFFQDRELTSRLAPGVPFREVRGWWEHVFPPGAGPTRSGEAGWAEIVTEWFDYWLKGVGPVPPLGVDHTDQLGTWHASSAWPPPEARDEPRYLTGGGLAARLGSDAVALVSPPVPVETSTASALLGLTVGGGAHQCVTAGALPGLSAAYRVAVREDLVLAGNPTVDLELTSNLPAGQVSVDLLDVGPGFSCATPISSEVRWLARGAAELGFHEDRYHWSAFPVDRPVRLHLDITDVTARIPAGHTLVVVVSHGDLERTGPIGAYPMLTIGGGSSITLPVLEGEIP